jgi:hypothetical protein
MPRPGPRLPLVALRLSPEVLATVDLIAAAEAGPGEEPNRSETIRGLLTEALRGRRVA